MITESWIKHQRKEKEQRFSDSLPFKIVRMLFNRFLLDSSQNTWNDARCYLDWFSLILGRRITSSVIYRNSQKSDKKLRYEFSARKCSPSFAWAVSETNLHSRHVSCPVWLTWAKITPLDTTSPSLAHLHCSVIFAGQCFLN